jgi:anthranilate synthase component 2
MLLMIDNYDSFTYNLVQYLQSLGAEVRVERNDAMTVGEIARLAPQRIVISPGPCTPNEAGVSLGVIERAGCDTPDPRRLPRAPGMGQVYGGNVIRAKGASCMARPRRSAMKARACSPACPIGYEATRYHSLVVERASLARCLEITAWTDERRWFDRRDHGLAPPRRSRSKACSSIPSRS